MPLISLDTDQAEATINSFTASHDNFESTLQSLNSSVQALEGVWVGTAQTQFMASWQQWLQAFQQSLAAMPPMVEGIRREKQELEEADGTSTFA